jgi:hypothetical protein
MRRIYNYMDKSEKMKLIPILQKDIEELEKELLNNNYPSIVRDSIEETIRRYNEDLKYLQKELS